MPNKFLEPAVSLFGLLQAFVRKRPDKGRLLQEAAWGKAGRHIL